MFALCLLLTLATGDTARRADSDSLASGIASDSVPVVPASLAAPADTVRRRPRAVEVSDAYALRLRIHQLASYTVIPLFVAQTVAGNQLYVNGGPTPSWAKSVHSLGAAALGAVFTVNTVTGAWNLWESRDNETGRTKRLIHSALMLASDAGFTYAGVKLAGDATRTQDGRDRHRRVAYISMGVALAGYGVMLVGNH